MLSAMLLFYLVLILSLPNILSYYVHSELVKSLLKYLLTSDCIIVMDEYDTNLLKYLSRHQIRSRYSTLEELENYVPHDRSDWEIMIYIHIRNIDHLLDSLSKIFTHYWESRIKNWVVFLESDPEYFFQHSESILFRYNGEFLLIYSINETYFRMLEIYKIRENMHIKEFGYWNSEISELNAPKVKLFDRRSDFEGAQLHAYGRKFDCITDKEECMHKELWEGLSKKLNFTTNYSTYADVIKGPKYMLNNAVIFDIYLNGHPLHWNYRTPEPLAVTVTVTYVLHIKTPLVQFTSLKSLAVPFNLEVWIAFVSWNFIAAVLLIIVEFVTVRHLDDNKAKAFILRGSFTGVINLLNNDDENVNMDRASTRIIILMFRIISLIVMPIYCGVITRMLTLQIPEKPFSDLEGLIKDGRYKITTEKSSTCYWHFQLQNDTQSNFLLENFFVREDQLPETSLEALQEMCRNDKIAYLNNGWISASWTSDICSSIQTTKSLLTVSSGILLAAFSQFSTILKQNFLIYFSSGILEILSKKLKTVPEEPIEVADVAEIGILHMIPLISILVFGCVCSLTILVLEILWKRKNIGKKMFFKSNYSKSHELKHRCV